MTCTICQKPCDALGLNQRVWCVCLSNWHIFLWFCALLYLKFKTNVVIMFKFSVRRFLSSSQHVRQSRGIVQEVPQATSMPAAVSVMIRGLLFAGHSALHDDKAFEQAYFAHLMSLFRVGVSCFSYWLMFPVHHCQDFIAGA